MSEPGFLGLGTELRIDIATVMTSIPYLGDIAGPNDTYEVIDATTHSSPGGRREFISGLADSENITVTINWHADEATHQALQDANSSREVTAFQLYSPQFATDNLVDFDGLVVGLTRAHPVGGIVQRELTIKVTGEPIVSTE